MHIGCLGLHVFLVDWKETRVQTYSPNSLTVLCLAWCLFNKTCIVIIKIGIGEQVIIITRSLPCCQKLPCFIMSCNLITRGWSWKAAATSCSSHYLWCWWWGYCTCWTYTWVLMLTNAIQKALLLHSDKIWYWSWVVSLLHKFEVV